MYSSYRNVWKYWNEDVDLCWEPKELPAGDLNGDQKFDLICYQRDNGHIWVAFATVNGSIYQLNRNSTGK